VYVHLYVWCVVQATGTTMYSRFSRRVLIPRTWQQPTRSSKIVYLIGKVLASNFRLLLIANCVMVLAVLLHSAVADWFLGDCGPHHQNAVTNHDQARAADPNKIINSNNNQQQLPQPQPSPTGVPPSINNAASTSHKRMTSFLVFKVLLISAVVRPDTVDVLILLSWYTVLLFLWSLASLGAQRTEQAQQQRLQTNKNIDNDNNVQQLQHSGVWKLLVFCLCMDCSAAAIFVGLVHGAGIGMVLLLTMDCALLGVDCTLILAQYWQWVWKWQHTDCLEQLKEQQSRLIATLQQQNSSSRASSCSSARHPSPLEEVKEEEGDQDEDSELDTSAASASPSIHASEAKKVSSELDRRMQFLEQQQTLRTAWLEPFIFSLQLLTDLLTIAHFLHIRWLHVHGFQLTLIDGVLALHLHSAIQSAFKKILERRHCK